MNREQSTVKTEVEREIPEKNLKLIALLDAWLEEDEEGIEDSSSFQEIMESLDEHRLSDRKLFS